MGKICSIDTLQRNFCCEVHDVARVKIDISGSSVIMDFNIFK